MFKLSFNTYTSKDAKENTYWRSSLLVTFDAPVTFLCAGDQVCLNDQYSIGNQCINHSFDSAAIKTLKNETLDDWLSVELASLKGKCPTVLTAVHAEKYHCVSEVVSGDFKVSAITTAGIKSNAVNVYHDRKLEADAANGKEDKENKGAEIGTINIVLCINVPLTETAMAQALGIVYESKASLFYDNNWKSAYSDNIATGTGTDSVIIASSINADTGVDTDAGIDSNVKKVNYTGSHSVIAGMISEVVRSSIECSVKKSGGQS